MTSCRVALPKDVALISLSAASAGTKPAMLDCQHSLSNDRVGSEATGT